MPNINAKSPEDNTFFGFEEYRLERNEYWNRIAKEATARRKWPTYYHSRLEEIYRNLVPEGQRVLEIGSGEGDLLSALKPSFGLGLDISEEMIHKAQSKHPELCFFHQDAHFIALDEKFDLIILSDLLNDVWDVQFLFEGLGKLCTDHTRIIINNYSRLWEIPLGITMRLGLSKPLLNQNWFTVSDIKNLLNLTRFEIIRTWSEIIWPVYTFGLDRFFNKFLARLWPIYHLALTNFIVARPLPTGSANPISKTVSVVIPARNESGNIKEILDRAPEMGAKTELIFVEGHSTDNTYEEIEEQINAHPERLCKLLQQTGKGKGDAVRLGFENASGDILMILDADITVPPEDLVRFYNALVTGAGEFVNGVRLTYPMEDQAMGFINLLGNKFFCLAFSWLLGQPIKDTLCGTKVIWRKDYQRIAENRAYFGDFDPFGDFDLLFGASKLNLKIVDLPIRYRGRIYGKTNINRWKDGWLLFKMVSFAARRLKFV